MKAQELIQKYNIIPNSFYKPWENPYKDLEKRIQEINKTYDGVGYPSPSFYEFPEYLALKNKWEKYVDYYGVGFALSQPTPLVFYKIVDEFLDFVKEMCPRFSIYKIGIEKGVLRIRLNDITKEVKDEITSLEESMYDQKLAK